MIAIARCVVLLIVLAVQTAPPTELGTIQGVVTRTGTAEPISNAEIILEGGVVSGTVADGPSKVVPRVTVGLVPESSRLENRALYATATADTSGRFTFRGVAPGDYRLFAVESVPPNAYQNLGFIRKHESRGHLVHVTQGSTVSAELALTR